MSVCHTFSFTFKASNVGSNVCMVEVLCIYNAISAFMDGIRHFRIKLSACQKV